ncbi:hypothetical protein GYMLUDRAFT_1025824 [Collybiopsis luxurians FD-317 M1]|nr:hypothetical protein GYMLUDRAFT_1025824 [Collybiopsis luxurians FD-317 M1]
MSIGTLYTSPLKESGKLIQVVAAYGGVSIDVGAYTHNETNKSPEFLAKFPHGKIPAFETKDGHKFFEGVVIAKYIATKAPNSGLLGSTPEDTVLVEQWVHLIETELGLHTDTINQLCVQGKLAYSKPIHTAFVERQQRTLATLNAHLTHNTFFVGERITLADLAFGVYLQRAVSISVDASHRAQYPAVVRLLETIANQDKIKSVFGEIKYIDKAVQFVAPKKEKEAKPPAAPAAPKEKKPAKKEVDDDDEDEPSAPPEPKVKNPLDDLPKSSFNLEDWKRAYSNKDTRGKDGALEWLYEHFDKDGFSLWRCDFKYNSELTQTFMSNNQIGGFFNRLEASRKYLFGSMGVLGTNNDSVISGVLILRGQEVEPVVNVAPDWESYEYKRIDLGNEKDKEFFEAALAWDLKVDGKEWVDGKNFK